MSRKNNPPPVEPLTEEDSLQDSAFQSRRRVEVLDAAAGAAAGAVAGIVAGPIGAAAGAVVGAAIGAVVGHVAERHEGELAQRSSRIVDIGRQDPVALSRKWAQELPDELYSTEEAERATSVPPPPPTELEEALTEGFEEQLDEAPDAEALDAPPAVQTPSLPTIEQTEGDEALLRQLEALDLRAHRSGRVLVSEPPPEVVTVALAPDALDSVLTAAGRKPNGPQS